MLKRIYCAIGSNCLVQKSSGLNLDCFGNIKSFSQKKKDGGINNCSNTLLQTVSRETRRWFFIYCLSPFLNVGTIFVFFNSEGNLPERKQFWKIISSGLHMDMPQSFIMQMLIMLRPWALLGSRFLIVFYVSFFEKTMVSKMLLVCLEHVLGKVVIFFHKVYTLF